MQIIARRLALLLFFIFASASLPAQARDLPREVIAELQNHALTCERISTRFSFDLNYLTQTDITGDGIADYIVSSRGFLCDNMHNQFSSRSGNKYYAFIATAGGYARYEINGRAYNLRIDNRVHPPYLYFTVPCGARYYGATPYGETRMRWDGRRIDVHGRSIGCRSHAHPVTPVPPRPQPPRPTPETPPSADGFFRMEELPPGVLDGPAPIP